MLNLILYTFAPILVAVGGDKLVQKTPNYVLKCVFDSITHGIIGVLSWIVLIHRSPTNRGYLISLNFEVILCGILASLVDIDHFIAARSFRLRDALNLGERRPIFHSSSLLFILVFPMLAVGKALLRKGMLFRLGLLILVSIGSHHIRDASRRGLWLPPWGSTPPLTQPVYLISIALLPHVVAAFIPLRAVIAQETFEIEVYWFAGALLLLVVILFVLVVTLYVKHSRLKAELLQKVKEVHKFNVPYIHPQEDLAKRGFSQYPQRNIALQH